MSRYGMLLAKGALKPKEPVVANTVHDILQELDDSTHEELEFLLRIETPEGSYQVESFRWESEAKHFVIEAGSIDNDE